MTKARFGAKNSAQSEPSKLKFGAGPGKALRVSESRIEQATMISATKFEMSQVQAELKRIGKVRSGFSPYALFTDDELSMEDDALSAIETELMAQLAELRVALYDEKDAGFAAWEASSSGSSTNSTRKSRKLVAKREVSRGPRVRRG